MSRMSRRQEERLKRDALRATLPVYFRDESRFSEGYMVDTITSKCETVSEDCVFKCNDGVYYVKLCGNGAAFENEREMYDRLNAEQKREIYDMFLHPIPYNDNQDFMLIFDNTDKQMYNLCEYYRRGKKYQQFLKKSVPLIQEMILTLNAAGYYHNDIHAGNILYEENADRFYFIDLEKMTIGRSLISTDDLSAFEELMDTIGHCRY
jgi:hypothetical protein